MTVDHPHDPYSPSSPPGPEPASAGPIAPAPRSGRLLDAVRTVIQARHYSRRTEKAYTGWIRRFILFHGKQHPKKMGHEEISAFLSHLATQRKVSASTQNQAMSALLFLYREVLDIQMDWVNIVRAKRPFRLPVVLTRQEVRTLLEAMRGTPWLVSSLLYGSGLRITEGMRLRIKDLDFNSGSITVRQK